MGSPDKDSDEREADEVAEGGRTRQGDDQQELGRVHHHVDRALHAVDGAAHVFGDALQHLQRRSERFLLLQWSFRQKPYSKELGNSLVWSIRNTVSKPYFNFGRQARPGS